MDATGKVRDLHALAAELDRLRAAGRRIAHRHGVFDLSHIGHIRHLEQARKLADVLVVTVTPDRFVNKGAGRPAFATRVVDRVGAGDAVFALTALCAAQEAPAELVGFLGNVIGAEAVAVLGNQRPVERILLYRHVECLLKMHKVADGEATTETRLAVA